MIIKAITKKSITASQMDALNLAQEKQVSCFFKAKLT
jgi:hypothetical protein